MGGVSAQFRLKVRFPRKKYVRCEEKRAEAGPQGSIR